MMPWWSLKWGDLQDVPEPAVGAPAAPVDDDTGSNGGDGRKAALGGLPPGFAWEKPINQGYHNLMIIHIYIYTHVLYWILWGYHLQWYILSILEPLCGFTWLILGLSEGKNSPRTVFEATGKWGRFRLDLTHQTNQKGIFQHRKSSCVHPTLDPWWKKIPSRTPPKNSMSSRGDMSLIQW